MSSKCFEAFLYVTFLCMDWRQSLTHHVYISANNPTAFVQLLFTVSVTPVIHNWWDIKDQNAQLVELIMFFKVDGSSFTSDSSLEM